MLRLQCKAHPAKIVRERKRVWLRGDWWNENVGIKGSSPKPFPLSPATKRPSRDMPRLRRNALTETVGFPLEDWHDHQCWRRKECIQRVALENHLKVPRPQKSVIVWKDVTGTEEEPGQDRGDGCWCGRKRFGYSCLCPVSLCNLKVLCPAHTCSYQELYALQSVNLLRGSFAEAVQKTWLFQDNPWRQWSWRMNRTKILAKDFRECLYFGTNTSTHTKNCMGA